MTAPLAPGAYLALRRTARGFSIEQVAARLHTSPRISQDGRVALIAQIEAGEQPASFATIAALSSVYHFDIDVLFRLELLAQGFAAAPPRLCRECGCSEDDACDGGCWWAGNDVCSECVTHAATSAAA